MFANQNVPDPRQSLAKVPIQGVAHFPLSPVLETRPSCPARLYPSFIDCRLTGPGPQTEFLFAGPQVSLEFLQMLVAKGAGILLDFV